MKKMSDELRRSIVASHFQIVRDEKAKKLEEKVKKEEENVDR